MDTYFERKQYKELLAWNEETEKPVLLITGMRGVGKTSLVAHFASEMQKRYIYIDFRSDGLIREFIASQRHVGYSEDRFSVPELVMKYLTADFSSIADSSFETDNSESEKDDLLFVFDGIDYSSRLEKQIFDEAEKGEYRNLSVILITDILQNSSFEFSYIKTIPVFPLDFEEYLLAAGHEWYRDVIRAHFENNKRIPSLIHDDLCDLVDTFIHIGGMPALVKESLLNASGEVSQSRYRMLHNDVLCSIADLSDETESKRTRKIYDAVFKQLTTKGKLKYSDIQKGTSYNYFKSAIIRLIRSGAVAPVYEKKEGTESSDSLEEGFRLYPSDSGICEWMLLSRGELTEAQIKEESLVCYIANELSKGGHRLYSWKSEGKAEITLMLADTPFEIEELVKKQKKSISEYKRHHPEYKKEIHISHRNFDFNGKEIFIPLYALFCL